jgi:uncharacterized membrane protein (DUF441 family)
MSREEITLGQVIIILLIVALLGVIGKNTAVTAAAGILLAFRFLLGEKAVPFLEGYALKTGITIITLAVLLPLATGEIGLRSFVNLFKSSLGLVSVLVGISIAYLGGRGVSFLTNQPLVLIGLLVGTIIGVAFFKGVPVGPLIGAGIVAVVLSVFS